MAGGGHTEQLAEQRIHLRQQRDNASAMRSQEIEFLLTRKLIKEGLEISTGWRMRAVEQAQ
jgi:hypothetical protein